LNRFSCIFIWITGERICMTFVTNPFFLKIFMRTFFGWSVEGLNFPARNFLTKNFLAKNSPGTIIQAMKTQTIEFNLYSIFWFKVFLWKWSMIAFSNYFEYNRLVFILQHNKTDKVFKIQSFQNFFVLRRSSKNQVFHKQF
jgi:hypothetical protein